MCIDRQILATYNVGRIIHEVKNDMALKFDGNNNPIRPVHPKEPQGFYRGVPYNWIVYNQQKIEYCNDLEEYNRITGNSVKTVVASGYSYCSKCGNQLKPQDAFCGKCGRPK